MATDEYAAISPYVMARWFLLCSVGSLLISFIQRSINDTSATQLTALRLTMADSTEDTRDERDLEKVKHMPSRIVVMNVDNKVVPPRIRAGEALGMLRDMK